MLGYHVLKDKSYEQSLTDAITNSKITSAQIFVAGPRSSTLVQMDHKKVKKVIEKNDISVYAHNTHTGHPWSGTTRVIKLIKDQIEVCKKAGLKGLVIHLPKKPLADIMRVLPDLVDDDILILLEIPSVKPDPKTSWESPEQINRLCKAIRSANIKNVKICVDTCHLFTSGYDVTTSEMVTKWLTDLKYPKMIGMIHLNDSAVPLGNGRDVHDIVMEGLIWKSIKPKKSGIKPFIEFAIQYNLPIILERTRIGYDDIGLEVDNVREHFF